MKYTEAEARALVVQAGHRLLECGLVARTWGNISARVSDTHFVITPSGRSYETLTPEDLVLVQISDCSYEGERKPSSEKGIHAAAYRHLSDTGFVIHTHQDYASCIGVSGKPLRRLANPLLGTSIPCASYGMPSTKKLQKGVEKAMLQYPEAKAIFMRQHGALCMAESFEEAFQMAQALEEVCRKEFTRVVTIPEGTQPEYGSLMKQLYSVLPEYHIAIETDAAVQAVAAKEKNLLPHLDDLSQIAGVSILCAKCEPIAISKALKHRNAVLVPGLGAVCCAKDKDDLEAIRMILRKSCMTALYADTCKAKPLSPVDRRIMRLVYTMKYAKKKAEQ